jgi:hypothetical protein
MVATPASRYTSDLLNTVRRRRAADAATCVRNCAPSGRREASRTRVYDYSLAYYERRKFVY